MSPEIILGGMLAAFVCGYLLGNVPTNDRLDVAKRHRKDIEQLRAMSRLIQQRIDDMRAERDKKL